MQEDLVDEGMRQRQQGSSPEGLCWPAGMATANPAPLRRQARYPAGCIENRLERDFYAEAALEQEGGVLVRSRVIHGVAT